MKPIYRDLSQFRVLYNKTGLICNGPKLYYKNRTYGSSGTAFYFKGFSHGLRLTFPGRNDVVDAYSGGYPFSISGDIRSVPS